MIRGINKVCFFICLCFFATSDFAAGLHRYKRRFRTSLELDVGDECFLDDDMLQRATCRLVPDCEPAVELLKAGGIMRDNFKRCGFEGHLEIVCCPRNTDQEKSDKPKLPVIGRQAKGKADDVCKEYQDTPVLTKNIVSGKEADADEFPHMAIIGLKPDRARKTEFLCGGSLISYSYVLTAAHCFIKRNSDRQYFIRVGEFNTSVPFRSDSDFDIEVEAPIRHPEYSIQTSFNDVAMLKLKKEAPLALSGIRPACLYTLDNDPNEKLTVTGVGATKFSGGVKQTEKLLKANVTAVPLETCKTQYHRPLFEGQLCAGNLGQDEQDSCQGDSGGPLQVRIATSETPLWSIVGIVSQGSGCGSEIPGIYTRVSKYIDWIESIAWPEQGA